MGKIILGMIAGFIVWTIIFVGGKSVLRVISPSLAASTGSRSDCQITRRVGQFRLNLFSQRSPPFKIVKRGESACHKNSVKPFHNLKSNQSGYSAKFIFCRIS